MTKDLIPLEDVLRIVTAPDGATIVAVHDRATRCLDVVCAACGGPYKSRFTYSPGIADDDLKKHRGTTAAAAVRHAAIRHTPRAATAGGQQP